MSLMDDFGKVRQEPGALQRWLSRKAFPLGQRLGFHLLGNHFYEPVPDTRQVAASYDDGPRDLGIDFRLAEAEERALALLAEHGAAARAAAVPLGYREPNHLFEHLDAVVYYAYLRDAKPARVIEIGSGFSTVVAAAALEANAAEGRAGTLTSIDPFARRPLARAPCDVRVDTVRLPLQDVDPAIFSELREGDLLFVDSSHVHKFGSDVAFQFEHVYPAVPAGVTIHIHDVFSPFHYPLNWYVRKRRFWNEQHFVETMLRWAPDLHVLLPVHALVRTSPAIREAAAATGCRPSGSSLYIRREHEA